MPKTFLKIFVPIILISWALLVSLYVKWENSVLSWPPRNNLSSSVVASTPVSPLPGLSCQKVSWEDENGDEVVDFVLMSEQNRTNTIRFLSTVSYTKDLSAQDLFSLLEQGGDITIWQNDYQKRKFHVAFSQESLTYTQSLFFQGAEYKCPPLEIPAVDELGSDTCYDLYAELDSEEAKKITCTGEKSFTVEHDISDAIFADTVGTSISIAALADTFAPSIFASTPLPPATQPRKKNIFKRIAGWTCRVVGNTWKTLFVVGMCPVEICQATINGVDKQLRKIPKVWNYFAWATSIAISKTPAGAYLILADVWGVIKKMVIGKSDAGKAILDQMYGEKPDNALVVLKWTGKQVCDIWTKK